MSYYLFNRQEILEEAKKDIQKKTLLNIIQKIKKSEKKKQGIVIKTYQRKKKTKSKSIKRKGIKN